MLLSFFFFSLFSLFLSVLGKPASWWHTGSAMTFCIPHPGIWTETKIHVVWFNQCHHWTSCFQTWKSMCCRRFERVPVLLETAWNDRCRLSMWSERMCAQSLLLGVPRVWWWHELLQAAFCAVRKNTRDHVLQNMRFKLLIQQKVGFLLPLSNCLEFHRKNVFKTAFKHFLFGQSFLFCLRGLSLCFARPPPFPSVSGTTLAFLHL